MTRPLFFIYLYLLILLFSQNYENPDPLVTWVTVLWSMSFCLFIQTFILFFNIYLHLLILMCSQNDENADPLATWVTVFGFPTASASYVISQVCFFLSTIGVSVLCSLSICLFTFDNLLIGQKYANCIMIVELYLLSIFAPLLQFYFYKHSFSFSRVYLYLFLFLIILSILFISRCLLVVQFFSMCCHLTQTGCILGREFNFQEGQKWLNVFNRINGRKGKQKGGVRQ